MTLVRSVSGPTSAAVADHVTYRVTAFSPAHPPAADAAAVSWLVKSSDGTALTNLSRHGRDLTLTVPAAWAGQRITVMPYMRSPSASVAVVTNIASRTTPAELTDQLAVSIARENGRLYASINREPRFYLGSDVRWKQRRGLMNSGNPPGPRYRPQDYEAEHGDWAWYLLPTITCESQGAFTCLNTYDRAAVTFGHAQLAAHTPDDNFVTLFRAALAQAPAAIYFPDLTVSNGRIHQRRGHTLTPLETGASSRALMDYFNASPDRIDPHESDKAARLVHWCMNFRELRDLQVSFVVDQQRKKLAYHATKLPLDGASDKLCIAVLDILHQGRQGSGGYPVIRAALRAADPLDALLSIGASSFPQRVATLRAGILALEAAGQMGRKVYDAGTKTFIVPPGA